jgi:hypothetical protein
MIDLYQNYPKAFLKNTIHLSNMFPITQMERKNEYFYQNQRLDQ